MKQLKQILTGGGWWGRGEGEGKYRETWKAPKISGILYLGTTMDSLTTVVFV